MLNSQAEMAHRLDFEIRYRIGSISTSTNDHMKKHSGTALVTGASGGIGLELAKLLAQDNYNLILVARGTEKLSAFAHELQNGFGIVARPVALDLTTPSAPHVLYARLQREGVDVNILVNNAAFGTFGHFAEIPLEDSLGQIQLDITALTALTRVFLPGMIERRRGRILNVASTAGFQAGPLMAVYYASKAYVISFSEAIASELTGSGVTVTCLCPGPTDTGFQGRAGVEESRLFRLIKPMDARTVALDGYHAMMKGRTLTISGLRNRLVAEAVRVSPRKMATAVSRWLADKAH